MVKYDVRAFSIPKLKGISEKNIEEHLKLYAGYVNNANLIQQKMEEYRKDPERNAYVLGELVRRFSFEYDGMRNHEVYFSSLSGHATPPSKNSALMKKIEEIWGSFDAWLKEIKSIALTRGIGWAALYYDPRDDKLRNAWVDEQHFGHLTGCTMVLGLDMWEHSYVYDYQPSGKKNYIEDFFANLNWENIEKNANMA